MDLIKLSLGCQKVPLTFLPPPPRRYALPEEETGRGKWVEDRRAGGASV